MTRRRMTLEEEQQETVRLIESTNRHVAELYVSANTELRLAVGEVMEENDKIESDRLKKICDDFEEFMTDDLGVTLVEDTRWGKGRVQDIATRSLKPDVPQPRPDDSVPKEMTLRRKNTGGVLSRILGRGTEIWEVDR